MGEVGIGRFGEGGPSKPRAKTRLSFHPGTVLFAGYGSTLNDPTVLGHARLRPAEDGFFLKLSYLFQM
jgi:hypothetical protein